MIRLAAKVVLRNGVSHEGEVLLHTSADDRPGQETLGRRLRRENFLPFRTGEDTVLVNLDHVAYLECEGRLPEVESHDEISGLRIPTRLELTHGEALSGDVLSTLPPDRGRASDLLNTLEGRFLLFSDSDRTRYVHRRAVVLVRDP